MIPTSVGEIATVVAGELHELDESVLVTGKVEFDSRRVGAGDLFLAFVGEHADGHDFAAAAIDAGAVAVMSTRKLETGCILVDDPLRAISALAASMAPRLRATVIEVTGSSGKTSTKDLLWQLLSRHGSTVAPPESFNNELGFPYTVLLADAETDFLVLETSARGVGHIRHLTSIAPPRIGAVLNVGSAHLGEFGSVEAIAQAKGELVEALPPAQVGGVAVLNADDPLVSAMAGRTSARVVTFGVREDGDVRAVDITLDEADRAQFTLVAQGESVPVALRVHGQHQVANALAAAAAALECGLSVDAVSKGLSEATARSRWRMEITELPTGTTLINDAYNANPDSMRAALGALARMSEGRRSIAVLGHMAELGPDGAAAHLAIGAQAAELGVDDLIAVGEQARGIADGAAGTASWRGSAHRVPDVHAASRLVAELARPGDVILTKGSRAAGMERVAASVITAQGGDR